MTGNEAMSGPLDDSVEGSILAIDAGTSAVKASLIDADGGFLAVERLAVPTRNEISLDPERYWQTVADAIAGVTAAATADGLPVDAVVVTGQGDGLWTLAADGTAAGPVYEWNTAVASEVVITWEADGTVEEQFRHSGTVLWSGTSAALWRWLQQADQAHADRVRWVFHAKDWINNRLCGAVATDVTDATIPFLDLATGSYDPAAFDRLGCTDLQDRMAPVVAAGQQIGEISPEAAARTGLPVGLPVLMGCIDGLSLMEGAGLCKPGQALAVLGTTAAGLVITDSVDTAGEPVGAILKLPATDRYLRFMGANSGTSTLDWFLAAFGYRSDDPLAQFWSDVANGQPGVMMLPYLAGERVPFLAPDATGTFMGLTPQTERADIARGVVAGITFSLRHCLESATTTPISSVVLSGGGAAAPEWCQMVADVTGKEVLVDERPHVACAGVRNLVTGVESADQGDLVPYHPATDYEDEYQQFVELGQALRPVWSAMTPARRRPDVSEGTE